MILQLKLKKSTFTLKRRVLAIHLRHSDSTLFGQLFLGFLTRIGIRQMRVEILIQHLSGLFVEVAPLASKRKNSVTNSFDIDIVDIAYINILKIVQM